MRVILDVNRPSSVSCGVQSCSSVEGFMEMKKLHPEDEFVIEEASADVYVDYIRTLASLDWDEFCDGMHIAKQDYDAMVDFYQNTEPLPDPVHDEKEFFEAFIDDDYDVEMMEETAWITKHC